MPGEDRNGQPHEADGGDLRRIKLFLEQYRAEEDAEQRIDKIAKRGIECAARADRPDIDAPVDADERGREACHGKHFRGFQRSADFRRATESDEDGGADRH